VSSESWARAIWPPAPCQGEVLGDPPACLVRVWSPKVTVRAAARIVLKRIAKFMKTLSTKCVYLLSEGLWFGPPPTPPIVAACAPRKKKFQFRAHRPPWNEPPRVMEGPSWTTEPRAAGGTPASAADLAVHALEQLGGSAGHAALAGDTLAVVLSFCAAADLLTTLPCVNLAFHRSIATLPHAWPSSLDLAEFPPIGAASAQRMAARNLPLSAVKSLRLGRSTALGEAQLALQAIAGCLGPNLWTLDASHCALSPRVLEDALAQCPQLRALNLAHQLGLREEALFALTQRCEHLAALSLAGCDHLSDASVRRALGTGRCVELTGLNLSDLTLSDATVAEVAVGRPGLRALSLVGCIGLTEAGFLAVVRQCRSLRSLALGGPGGNASMISDAVLQALRANCAQLERLALVVPEESCEGGLRAVVRGCRGLRDLTLRGLAVTDGVASELAGSACAGSLCRLAIDSRNLGRLAGVYPCLVELDLCRCFNFTDLSDASFPALETVELQWCKLFSDASLISLGRCAALRRLTMFAFQRVTNEGVRAFAEGPAGASLTTASLRSGLVNWRAVEALVEKCPRLTFLRFGQDWVPAAVKDLAARRGVRFVQPMPTPVTCSADECVESLP
jgi:hypothetical protein